VRPRDAVPPSGFWAPAGDSDPADADPAAGGGGAADRGAAPESPRRGGAGRTAGEPLPARLPVLPLAQIVVFPHVVAPLLAATARTIEAVDRAVETHKRVLLGVVRPAQGSDQPPGVLDDIAPEMLFDVGTLGAVVRLLKLGDGNLRMLIQGVERVKLTELADGPEGFTASFHPIRDTVGDPLRTEALRRQVSEKMQRVIELAPNLVGEMREVLDGITDPGKLSDFCAANLSVDVAAKAALLGMGDVTARLEKLATLLDKEIQVLEVGSQIQEKLKSRLDEHQREYVLREQMRLIQEELGEGPRGESDVAELTRRLEAAKPTEDALKAGRRELDRLERMSPQSAEYQVARTYIELLAGLPWSAASEDRLDIANARAILDRDHYDLVKVKDRIIEYLAVRHLNPAARGSILCFVGPPGVGKTSLGQSIAEALGRKFVRMALGGVRDEAEIRGHRRTYVGALPGRIIQLIQKAGTRNPLFMLDEVDKLGADFRGDPTSALLEVLDPAQNHSFVDHYVEVAFDLTDVMFITTANTLATVPAPLIDRMEVLELPGYTAGEKLHIAKRYLVPRQLAETGLGGRGIVFGDKAIDLIVGEYTREAGVRQLEREIQHVLRHTAVDVVAGRAARTRVTPAAVRRCLGPPRILPEMAGREPEVGISTGLVWTPVGGDIVFIEAIKLPGSGEIMLTGQLGDVMKESARAAWSFVRARAESLGISAKSLRDNDIHVHVPAGAVPKDGPSAGVAIATALASLLSGRPVRHDVAATGEITLRGHVLPVGGIKEKLIAAARAGIRLVMVPARNAADVEEVPEEVRRVLEVRGVSTVDEVLAAALLPPKGAA